jgi:hypothetical protein
LVKFKKTKPDKTCTEEEKDAEFRKSFAVYERRFKYYLLFATLYGLIFINYIDITINPASSYHIWLSVMYFFPFILLTLIFPRNWALTIGLGLYVSLMNDIFYGAVKFAVGIPYDLGRYYSLWLIPNWRVLFTANLGFAMVEIYSWMMAFSIYIRIFLVYVLLHYWHKQRFVRCIEDKGKPKSVKQHLKDIFA